MAQLKSAGTLSERIQIINDEKNFTPDLSSQIEKWGLRDVGFDYNIVSVFGSQSTGKSTLLNRLFGTTFDVMDETQRQQTTKGIWMCRGKEMSVMVMDVEGTDGRERGEDQDFERKSALFSLASSEVLIINLWEHQVGLYQGANMGLLKTVFEVNLGLFGKKGGASNGRTLLLFVIRDHIGVTPLANLQATLTADLNRIWDSLSKPTELQDRLLSDYFDLSFTTLPHKVLASDQFESSVVQLRQRFINKSADDYLFKPAYHKGIPADGVAFYMENIWEQVQTNKDLDLPTQQELLAQFRCDEISAGVLRDFGEQSKPQKRPVEAGNVVQGLGGMMRSWRKTALETYDRDASRYHQGVYKRKRTDLIVSMDSFLSPLFLGQLKNLHKLCLVSFKEQLLAALKGDDYSFADVVELSRSKWEKEFAETAKETVVDEEDTVNWSWKEELEVLKQEMSDVAVQCRKDETKKMVNAIERTFRKQISEPVEMALHLATPDMWDRVFKAYKEKLDSAETAYLTKAKSFNTTEAENASSLEVLRARTWQALRGKIEELTAEAVILGKLRAHFEERFRYDSAGVPRVWKPEDDIDEAFKSAKDQTLELIPLYSKIAPQDPKLSLLPPPSSSDDEFDPETSLVIFTETKALDLTNKFRKDADAYYVEAKRSTVASIAQIPVWMYGVLVVLGWNEAMAVLFNPLYFAMMAIGLVTAYIIVQLGLVGPLMSVSTTVAREVQRQAGNKLREHFSAEQIAVMNDPMKAQRVNGTMDQGRVQREKEDMIH